VNVNLSHVKEIWPRRVALQAPSDGRGAFVAGELSTSLTFLIASLI
jgi:hypothetical protein